MLERIMDLVFKHLPAERGFLSLYDATTDCLTPTVARFRPGIPPSAIRMSRSISAEVIKSKKSVLVRDAAVDERFGQAPSLQSLEIQSALCAPLYYEGSVAGLIYVDTRSAEQPFAEQHLEALTTLAVLSAVGVQQKRLRDEVVKEQSIRKRMARYSSPSVIETITRTAK